MNELFEPESRSIFTFKKGDLIIRIKKAEIRTKQYNENLGVEVDCLQRVDGSFTCEPMEFIAIENNVIYLKHPKGSVFDDISPSKLFLPDWCEGWALFKIPNGLTLKDCL